jgi:plastocyanin
MVWRILASLGLALLPFAVAADSLAAAPAPAAPSEVTVLFDQAAQTKLSTQAAKAQGIASWTVTAHDTQFSYNFPLCSDATLVESDGRGLTDPSALVAGDALTLSLRPNPATDAKGCIGRIVRQQPAHNASGGECLQHFQIIHEVDGADLVTDHQYTFTMWAYNRPTLDCDRLFYGSNPITTTIAPRKPFVVTLYQGSTEVTHWQLTTDQAGQAQFGYSFATAGDKYKFEIKPDENGTPGDTITWTESVADAHPATATTAKPPVSGGSAGGVVLAVLGLAAGVGGAVYWQRRRRRPKRPRDDDMPPPPTAEQETGYQRIKQL